MTSRQHKLLYASSYDRGLEHLLDMWPDIIAKYPDATLDIAYGWDTFLALLHNNPERMAWKEKMTDKMSQAGITHRGRIGKEELKTLRESCGIWAYPTNFTEINCITALEAQSDGCVPCVIDYAALKETVGAGVKVQGDIYDKEAKEEYLQALLNLMGDQKLWETEQAKGIAFARNYDWSIIAKQWDNVFKEEPPLPKVTIYTPTVRTGWEEMMTKNIQEQTYKGEIEWIVVNDLNYGGEKPEYAGVKYMEGSHEGYRYGLSHANNIAMKHATGELLVVLQDYMLMGSDCIEDMVNLYRKNPECLITTVDVGLDKDKKEVYRNVRLSNQGLRFTNNPFDFELNCGAIPMNILKDLNGWYELLDDGLGYDNTEIAYRALQKGYKVIIDETNVVTGLYHEPREHMPDQEKRYLHIINSLPVVRDEKLDKKLIL